MTISAASRRISELEQHVGSPLFERKSRGLDLTAAGRELLPHAQSVTADVERLIDAVVELENGQRGHIRIWANTSSLIQFLPRDLFRFRTQFPNVKIELEERLSSEIIRALHSGHIDMGVIAENTPAVGLERIVYRSDRLVLVVPEDHPIAALPIVSFDDAIKHDFVGTNHDSAILRLLTNAAASRGQIIRINIQATSFDAILSLIHAGHGVSILPREAVAKDLVSWRLKSVPLRDAWSRRKLWLTYRASDALKVEVKNLIEHLSTSSAIG